MSSSAVTTGRPEVPPAREQQRGAPFSAQGNRLLKAIARSPEMHAKPIVG